MFRTVSITSLIIIVAGIVCHFAYSKPKSPSKKNLLKPKNAGIIPGFRMLVYLAAIACFAVLLFTGFFPKLVLKETISGYWLMAHATAAPPFIACVAILALMWPGHSSLKEDSGQKRPFGEHEFGLRLAFWIVMALSLPLIMSIVLSMLPVYGTHMQEVMADLHRYTALVVAGAAIIYIYLSILAKAKQQDSALSGSCEVRKAG